MYPSFPSSTIDNRTYRSFTISFLFRIGYLSRSSYVRHRPSNCECLLHCSSLLYITHSIVYIVMFSQSLSVIITHISLSTFPNYLILSIYLIFYMSSYLSFFFTSSLSTTSLASCNQTLTRPLPLQHLFLHAASGKGQGI